MQVAYFMPSSPWLIDQVAKCAHLSDAQNIMELGPGTGGTTKGILKYMTDDLKHQQFSNGEFLILRLNHRATTPARLN